MRHIGDRYKYRDLAGPALVYRDVPSATIASLILEEQEQSAAADRAQRYRGRWRERVLNYALAARFGAERGWQLSGSTFGLVTLQRGKQHSGSRRYVNDEGNGYWVGECDTFDHPYWYRRDKKAAAMVAHLYGFDQSHRERCEEIARRYDLAFEVPDFPSWWFPGQTTLVAYIGPAGLEVTQ